MSKSLRTYAAAILATAIAPVAARAVIFTSTGDPNYNTTAPTGTYANSGWQWQGDFGGFTGTPISTHYFITAQHIGATNSITFNNVTYSTTALPDNSPYLNIGPDLRLWRISGTFPTYAPIWDTTVDGTEKNRLAVVIGRGTERGANVTMPQVGGTLRGWQWGADSRVRRWGTNTITDIVDFNDNSNDQEMIQFDFNANVGNGLDATEVALSGGDSGGGLFIQSGNQWKLAAVNYGVTGPYTYTANSNNANFFAALTNAGNFYYPNTSIPIPSGTPTSSYSSRVALHLGTLSPYLSPTWNKATSGTWSTATNWQGPVPSGVDAEANFRSAIASGQTITLDSNRTVGQMYFDNASRYTIGGTSTLTLSTFSGTAGITVYSGSHTIAAPVNFSNNTSINVIPSSSIMTISGNVTSAGGISILKQGAGTAELPNIRSFGLLLSDGTLRTTANGTNSGTSALNSAPTFSATGRLDLTNNKMVINYTGSSPLGLVRSALVSGRGTTGGYDNGETWNGTSGIISSTAQADVAQFGVGYAENSDLPLGAYTSFGGQTVGSSSVLVKYTRNGDTDLDGVVGDSDVSVIGVFYNPTSTAFGQWYYGDMDYSGSVDDADVTILGVFYNPGATPVSSAQLTAQYGSGFAAAFERGRAIAASSAVPEPAVGSLLFLLGGGLLHRRRRQEVMANP